MRVSLEAIQHDIDYHKSKYHRLHPHARYNVKGGKAKEDKPKVCKMCGVPLPKGNAKGHPKKFCSVCLNTPRCRQCHVKPKLPHSYFCKDCKEARIAKRIAKSKLTYEQWITTKDYRDWYEKYEQTPERKESHAKARQRYLATPYGRTRSNFLNNRSYRRLHNKPEITFEQYLQQIARVSLSN